MRIFTVLIFLTIMACLPSAVMQFALAKRSLGKRVRRKRLLTAVIWAAPVTFLLVFLALGMVGRLHLAELPAPVGEWYLWAFVTAFFPAFMVALCYLIDLLLSWLFRRKKRLRLMEWIGGPLAVLTLAGLVTGAATRHSIKVREVTIASDHVPVSFDGTRIVQITDLHMGNLTPERPYLKRITDTIRGLKPDLLLFTGDLVNMSAKDGEGKGCIFCPVETRYGRYAVMGNHDYGEYVQWKSDDEKEDNLRRTYRLYGDVGFTLLNDTALYISNGIDSIGLIGTENWSLPPFPQYGSLSRAVEGFAPARFNILMSHDPIVWEEEVMRYPYINLTLSGHTHAAQMGIDCGEVKFSPSQWVYDKWDGLYTKIYDNEREGQALFISRGLGYVGIPFRLGMLPEITVITLRAE
ncbi:MAG: metallophosphoesterase [bacterium]|uniref:Metallophosphoesterase n=1 Tax=Candidatus Aphodosoma intestinipullorum TaxID=2840674 RepID=A0A940IF97_9BACT|nr:metallophosphoesterase [Candidatus Aphodosoma intestinipullorum]